jgi:hypothetical protein
MNGKAVSEGRTRSKSLFIPIIEKVCHISIKHTLSNLHIFNIKHHLGKASPFHPEVEPSETPSLQTLTLRSCDSFFNRELKTSHSKSQRMEGLCRARFTSNAQSTNRFGCLSRTGDQRKVSHKSKQHQCETSRYVCIVNPKVTIYNDL